MTQVPLLDRNGIDLLLPRDGGHGAERITPDDPRYEALRPQAVDLNVPDDPAADAVLAAQFERHFRATSAA